MDMRLLIEIIHRFLSVWWYTPEVLLLGRLGQEDHDLGARLSYIVRT